MLIWLSVLHGGGVLFFFWTVVAIWELDTVLNSNAVSTGCSELPAPGLWWSMPELQRCHKKALKTNEVVLLEILLMLLVTLYATHGVVKA